jgi:hypothetical protein
VRGLKKRIGSKNWKLSDMVILSSEPNEYCQIFIVYFNSLLDLNKIIHKNNQMICLATKNEIGFFEERFIPNHDHWDNQL